MRKFADKLEMLGSGQNWIAKTSMRLLAQAITNTYNHSKETNWIETHETFVNKGCTTYNVSGHLTPRAASKSRISSERKAMRFKASNHYFLKRKFINLYSVKSLAPTA